MSRNYVGNVTGGAAIASVILFILIIVFTFGGWINNINYVVDSDFSDVSGREVVAVIGIVFPPLGVINGDIYYFEDEKNELVVSE